MIFEDLKINQNIETKKIEFKGTIGEGKDEDGDCIEKGWLKTITAFANSSGGTMYIGVENGTHKIMSYTYDELDKITLMVRRQIKNRIEPHINYEIKEIKIPLEDRYILSITVYRNKILPVFLHIKEAALVYIRYFGSTILANSEQIKELVLLSEDVTYDGFITDIKYKKDYFSSLFKKANSKRGEELTEKILFSSNLIDSNNYLRKGALLFKDDYDGTLTRLDCTIYPGIDKGSRVFVNAKTFCGPILNVIDETYNFIDTYYNGGYSKDDTGRKEIINYPKRSLFEGLVNAFAHRNYFIFNSQIQVDIFKDRLEIASPGSLLINVDSDKIYNIADLRPTRRNEIIARILETCHYMENQGTGFDIICSEYKSHDEAHRPFIKINPDSFILVLPNLTYEPGIVEDDNYLPNVYVEHNGLTERDYKILSFCYMKSRTLKEIAVFINMQVSSYLRNDIMQKLINKQYIIYFDSKTKPKYLANRDYVLVK